MKHSFLLLQGIRSPFFRQLGLRLRAGGHAVHKINFMTGDWLYWQAGGAQSYRNIADALPAYYKTVFGQHGITDIVLFGDCRPVHRPAIRLARECGIRIHVFEEGYFRPYWITLERNGVNAYSDLPRDPAWYREMARHVPHYDNGTSFTSSFRIRATHDVLYNAGRIFDSLLYPGYCSHDPCSIAAEYLSYIRRSRRVLRWRKKDLQITAQLVTEAPYCPYFLFPLQLCSDVQIQYHSPFKDMHQAMQYIMASFARHAPIETLLVVKNHPLDPGFQDYRALMGKIARQHGITGRVFYLETGHMPTLLSSARGIVTVNSTVGGSALVHNCPTIALGEALYNLPGLTFQEGLDAFWENRRRPGRGLFTDFRNVVIHSTQINGGFYSREGIELAVTNAAQRLTQAQSPLEILLGIKHPERNVKTVPEPVAAQ